MIVAAAIATLGRWGRVAVSFQLLVQDIILLAALKVLVMPAQQVITDHIELEHQLEAAVTNYTLDGTCAGTDIFDV